jgi:hypothetical protein
MVARADRELLWRRAVREVETLLFRLWLPAVRVALSPAISPPSARSAPARVVTRPRQASRRPAAPETLHRPRPRPAVRWAWPKMLATPVQAAKLTRAARRRPVVPATRHRPQPQPAGRAELWFLVRMEPAGRAATPTPPAPRRPVVPAARFLQQSRRLAQAAIWVVLRMEPPGRAAMRLQRAGRLRQPARARRHRTRARTGATAVAEARARRAATPVPAARRGLVAQASHRHQRARREAAGDRHPMSAPEGLAATLSLTVWRKADWAARYHPRTPPGG